MGPLRQGLGDRIKTNQSLCWQSLPKVLSTVIDVFHFVRARCTASVVSGSQTPDSTGLKFHKMQEPLEKSYRIIFL